MEVDATRLAVVGEAIALASTGITAEEAFWVDWDWEKGEDMVLIKRVFDLVGIL